jgi:hypothetical protein
MWSLVWNSPMDSRYQLRAGLLLAKLKIAFCQD